MDIKRVSADADEPRGALRYFRGVVNNGGRSAWQNCDGRTKVTTHLRSSTWRGEKSREVG